MTDYFILLFRRSNVIYLIQQLVSEWTTERFVFRNEKFSKSYSFVLLIYFVIIFILIEMKGSLLLERAY